MRIVTALVSFCLLCSLCSLSLAQRVAPWLDSDSHLQLNKDNTAADVFIYAGDAAADRDHFLVFDVTDQRWETPDDFEVQGTLVVTGGISGLASLTVAGSFVGNEGGGDNDSRFEGDTEVNLLFIDAGTNRVGIRTATPGYVLEVEGTLFADDYSGGAIFNETGAAVDFRVESDTNANMLFVDGTNNRVGIGTGGAAGAVLDVSGITRSTSFLSTLYSSNASNAFRTGSGGDLTLDVGGNLLVRDRDSAFATVFSIASATGDTTIVGDLGVTGAATFSGEINGSYYTLSGANGTQVTLNSEATATQAMKVGDIEMSLDRGWVMPAGGSVLWLSVIFDVTAHAGGSANLRAVVYLDGGAVFNILLDETPDTDKTGFVVQTRGPDTFLAGGILVPAMENAAASDITIDNTIMTIGFVLD